MDDPRAFRLYLAPRLIRRVEAGRHTFLSRLTSVLAAHGYRPELCPTGPAARRAAPDRAGWAMFHMEHPTHDRALVFRKVYHAPFWAIERNAQRWHWPVARALFPCDEVDPGPARAFYRRWQRRIFGDAPGRARRDGFVYIPLQGKLLRHRAFQDCAPLRMLETTLAREPRRRLLVTLHPGENYTRAELDAVEDLSRRFPRLQLVDRPMADCLRDCDYVVTENSSAAFLGFFFGKPAITFARIDFHHVCLGADGFDRIASHAPDYELYIWWFWQKMSINAGRPEVDTRIADRLRRCGVPLPAAAEPGGAEPGGGPGG